MCYIPEVGEHYFYKKQNSWTTGTNSKDRIWKIKEYLEKEYNIEMKNFVGYSKCNNYYIEFIFKNEADEAEFIMRESIN